MHSPSLLQTSETPNSTSLAIRPGRFGQTLAFSATQPKPIRFWKSLPVIRVQATKSAEFRVGRVGYSSSSFLFSLWRLSLGSPFFSTFFFFFSPASLFLSSPFSYVLSLVSQILSRSGRDGVQCEERKRD